MCFSGFKLCVLQEVHYIITKNFMLLHQAVKWNYSQNSVTYWSWCWPSKCLSIHLSLTPSLTLSLSYNLGLGKHWIWAWKKVPFAVWFAHVGGSASSSQHDQRRLHRLTPSLPAPLSHRSLSQLHRPVSQSMAGLSGPAEAPAHGGGSISY